jgi:hypothetical protein
LVTLDGETFTCQACMSGDHDECTGVAAAEPDPQLCGCTHEPYS